MTQQTLSFNYVINNKFAKQHKNIAKLTIKEYLFFTHLIKFCY
jgi:hypothetical protein